MLQEHSTPSNGTWVENFAEVCSLYVNFNLKSVSWVLGECVRASASWLFFFSFLVIFFLFYSLMKLLRKCSSVVSKSHETGGASWLWLVEI